MNRTQAWILGAFAGLVAAAVFVHGSLSTPMEAERLLGEWVEPVPGMPSLTQGVLLRGDGTAESIDMATLRYRRWYIEDRTLVLEGVSVGNGLSFDFEERWSIQVIDDTRLHVVDDQGHPRVYVRP